MRSGPCARSWGHSYQRPLCLKPGVSESCWGPAWLLEVEWLGWARAPPAGESHSAVSHFGAAPSAGNVGTM